MNKVFQETPKGCFRACVACIFSLDFWDVPECFDAGAWNWGECQLWLSSATNTQAILIERQKRLRENVLQIGWIVGESPLMILGYTHPDDINKPGHAVVGCVRDKEIVIIHDPSKSPNHRYGDLSRITMFVRFKHSAT